MRTPKRKFFQLEDDGLLSNIQFNAAKRDDEAARWKRKNRETQLRRTIAKYKIIGKGWQEECIKERAEYKRKLALWRSRAYAADLSFAAVWAIIDVMNSAYMQDVEGS